MRWLGMRLTPNHPAHQLMVLKKNLVHEFSKSDSHSRVDSVSSPLDYSKTLINDFEKHRSRGCFEAGQLWACYDYHNPKYFMPRLYVRIMKVLSDSEYDFRRHTAFLQPTTYADSEELQKYDNWEAWINAGEPVGCGNFKQADMSIRYLYDFSHQMCCEDICSPFHIYPMKGEIWALYKNRDINAWVSDPENHRNCKYEIVEVLDKDDSTGSTRVAYLDKIVGFVSLFKRRSQNENDSFVINRSDIFRLLIKSLLSK
ncbi:hypothetical protein ACH5RR_031273 [Cinchona calisaya]|uniref:DUF3444 domain-containing protein n=1 Tax=Cinchona calisaya TaxID=153742 RepID=A0ABD2YG29_9GENT